MMYGMYAAISGLDANQTMLNETANDLGVGSGVVDERPFDCDRGHLMALESGGQEHLCGRRRLLLYLLEVQEKSFSHGISVLPCERTPEFKCLERLTEKSIQISRERGRYLDKVSGRLLER